MHHQLGQIKAFPNITLTAWSPRGVPSGANHKGGHMMLGSRWAMGLALVGTPAIWADIQSAEIVPLGGIHPDGIAVYQVVVNFDNAHDTVLAVGGNGSTGTDLSLKANAPLAQDHPFGVWTDIPDARAGDGDSWFGIGGQADTKFDRQARKLIEKEIDFYYRCLTLRFGFTSNVLE